MASLAEQLFESEWGVDASLDPEIAVVERALCDEFQPAVCVVPEDMEDYGESQLAESADEDANAVTRAGAEIFVEQISDMIH